MRIIKIRPFTLILFGYLVLFCGIYFINGMKMNSKYSYGSDYTGRRLLTISNCTPRSVEEFPPDFMSRTERQNGGILLYIIISVYLIFVLAIVCDGYFVPALERICEVLHLKRDIAGATFMAIGSSAPELFTAFIGIFVAKSDVGVSTIVGSAIVNVLVIAAICGLLSKTVVRLNWWPIFRDCFIYAVSVLTLILVIFDGQVHWYEAMVFPIIYAIYTVILYKDSAVYSLMTRCIPILKSQKSNYTSLVPVDDKQNSFSDECIEDNPVKETETTLLISQCSSDENMDESEESIFEIPETFIQRLHWVAVLPANVIFFLTIPNCQKPGIWKKLYMITLLMSIVWIAVVTYVLVWMVCMTGDTLGIPDTVMGLTLLAAGASVPDIISSVLVARQGHSNMALSNGFGSNIIDILLCLGGPWFILTAIIQPGSVILVSSSGMTYTGIVLFFSVICVFVALWVSKWTINKSVGIMALAAYIITLVLSCLYELDVFGKFSLPPCARTRS